MFEPVTTGFWLVQWHSMSSQIVVFLWHASWATQIPVSGCTIGRSSGHWHRGMFEPVTTGFWLVQVRSGVTPVVVHVLPPPQSTGQTTSALHSRVSASAGQGSE